MVISKFSKDGKSGFSVGSNSLTPDKVTAGAVTAFSALIIMIIGGVFRLFAKPHKKDKKNEKGKHKKPVWMLALPIIYKQVKKKARTADTKEMFAELLKEYSGNEGEEEESANETHENDIEVVEAIPISSEDEVYEYI